MERRSDLHFEDPPPQLEAAVACIGLMRAISGKWKLSILWSLSPSPLRFGELRRAIPGITQNMLTHQLRELEEDGFIKRTVYPETPVRVE
jgi:DNA-binding HxlR family transcriptional regulator